VCGGGQRHARVRRDEGGEPVRHRRIESYWCRRALAHDYIVVGMSRADNLTVSAFRIADAVSARLVTRHRPRSQAKSSIWSMTRCLGLERSRRPKALTGVIGGGLAIAEVSGQWTREICSANTMM